MTVRVERSGPVATVLIDRPEVRNAVDAETAAALLDAFGAVDADRSIRAAVLAGTGGTFCSGADLHAAAAGRPNRLEPDGPGPMGPTRMLLGVPVIAAIEGYAVAGGLELAIWCDLRVMAADAVFGVFCRRWGVPLIDGGTVRLPHLVGLGRALDLILTGRPVDAAEAAAIGLADRVVPPGTARAAAEELAQTLAALPAECLRHDRLSVHEGLDLPRDAALANEFRHGMISLASAAEGIARFAAGAGRRGTDSDTEDSAAGT